MQLRNYQQSAVNAVYNYLRARDDNPCVVLPTAAGKTPCLATICRDAVVQWGGRVLILSHVKELLEQAVDKLKAIAPEVKPGVYSASLGRRDTEHSVIVAGIQSVYKKACELGPFDLILVDEAHLIPPDGEGMYQTFLSEMKVVNPLVRLIGFTATAFRMRSGMICGPDNLLNNVCYEIGVAELIRDGFLCPLISKNGTNRADLSNLHVRAGEFIESEVEALSNSDDLVDAAVREILSYTADRNAVLIFAAGIAHGEHITQKLANLGQTVDFISGSTRNRSEIIDGFKSGKLKFLVNVNVLTTGFDAPHIDCVVLLRPTLSPGLYYQMVGRGFRLHSSKQNCLVLDFGENVERHGPVDEIKPGRTKSTDGNGPSPIKECPQCQSLIKAGYSQCPDCGFWFPDTERKKHSATASDAAILSEQKEPERREVKDTRYSVHVKRGASPDAPRTMRVDYHLGLYEVVSEWVCFEHEGFALKKAHTWWSLRSPDAAPVNSEHAVELCEAGAVRTTEAILIREKSGSRFFDIVDYELGPMPEPLPPEDRLALLDKHEDLPF